LLSEESIQVTPAYTTQAGKIHGGELYCIA
jgi:hypothetical protein